MNQLRILFTKSIDHLSNGKISVEIEIRCARVRRSTVADLCIGGGDKMNNKIESINTSNFRVTQCLALDKDLSGLISNTLLLQGVSILGNIIQTVDFVVELRTGLLVSRDT